MCNSVLVLMIAHLVWYLRVVQAVFHLCILFFDATFDEIWTLFGVVVLYFPVTWHKLVSFAPQIPKLSFTCAFFCMYIACNNSVDLVFLLSYALMLFFLECFFHIHSYHHSQSLFERVTVLLIIEKLQGYINYTKVLLLNKDFLF